MTHHGLLDRLPDAPAASGRAARRTPGPPGTPPSAHQPLAVRRPRTAGHRRLRAVPVRLHGDRRLHRPPHPGAGTLRRARQLPRAAPRRHVLDRPAQQRALRRRHRPGPRGAAAAARPAGAQEHPRHHLLPVRLLHPGRGLDRRGRSDLGVAAGRARPGELPASDHRGGTDRLPQRPVAAPGERHGRDGLEGPGLLRSSISPPSPACRASCTRPPPWTVRAPCAAS
jgi:hypothetical protein